MASPKDDMARALALTPVSHETRARLESYVDLLLRWQSRINLIAPSTIPQVWTRHVADSLQLIPHLGGARILIDFGSGAGFPGLVLACALADVPGAHVHLVESNQKKAAFLREAARITGAPASVHAKRAEDIFADVESVDMVIARALAPVETLLEYAHPYLQGGATALFLKGQDVEAELTLATKSWNIGQRRIPSLTASGGCLLMIDTATPRGRNGKN